MQLPSRRRVIQWASTAAATTVACAAGGGSVMQSQAPRGSSPSSGTLPTRKLGKTAVDVSLLCLGGYHLGNVPSSRDAVELVHEALDHGINFFDSAHEYHAGRSELWLGEALRGKRDRAFVMTKLCTHGRDKKTAMIQLEESLTRLQTDHLDLWQIHEVAFEDDPRNHFAKDGAIEALAQAKKDGKVRFVGFTGHKSPKLHLEMLSHGFPFDTCQLPLNPLDGTYESFEREVLPELQRQGIAAIGMKSLGGTGIAVKEGIYTPEESIRYVLSLPIASLVSGIDSREVLHQNLDIAKRFQPMTENERVALRERVSGYARKGGHELYKTTRNFEGPVARIQHGLPVND